MGATPHCHAQASHCSGFSHGASHCGGFSHGASHCGGFSRGASHRSGRARALGWVGCSSCGPQVLEHGLSSCGTGASVVPWHVGSSWRRDRTCVPCIGRLILNHWIIRGASTFLFYPLFLVCLCSFHLFR